MREGFVSSESAQNTIRQLLTRYREYEGLSAPRTPWETLVSHGGSAVADAWLVYMG